MTADHNPDAAFDLAVQWIIENPPERRPRACSALRRELFGLDPVNAVAAIRRANAIRMQETRNDAS